MRALLVSLVLAQAQVVADEAARLTAQGDSRLASGDPAGAADSYRQAIAANPRAFEARVNLGAALLKLSDADGAIEALQAAESERSDSAPLLRNLGRALLARERFAEATDALRKAANLEAESGEGARLLGIALHRSGSAGEAIGWLRKASSASPQDLETLVELAAAETDAGDPAAPADADRARGLLTVAGGPQGARLLNDLGLVLRTQGRTAVALETFRVAARLDPGYGPALANLGMALLEAGQAKAAVGTLATAARQDSDPEIRYALGQARLLAGDPKGAISDLELARELGYHPKRIEAALADCYAALGERAKAEKSRGAAGGAVGLPPGELEARAGYQALTSGHWAEAVEKLGAAARARPEDGPISYDLGLARLRAGDPRGALVPLEAAAQALPAQPEVFYLLGAAHRQLGQAEEAAGAWSRMLELAPDRFDVTASLGHLLLEAGKDAEAVDRLSAAARALPRDPDVRYDLAVGMLRLHRSREAAEALERYLKDRPGDAEARQAWADALLDAGEAKRAAAEFASLGRKEPRVARHPIDEARAWRKAGDPPAEKTALLRAAALAPWNGPVWNDLGRLQFADRQWSEAAASFQRAAELDPKNPDAARNAETARKNGQVEAMKASRLHLGILQVKTRAQAEGALAKLKKGRPFSELARDLSTHPSAHDGGDLGWVEPGTLPAWAEPAKHLARGKTSPVLSTGDGFAIFLRYPD